MQTRRLVAVQHLRSCSGEDPRGTYFGLVHNGSSAMHETASPGPQPAAALPLWSRPAGRAVVLVDPAEVLLDPAVVLDRAVVLVGPVLPLSATPLPWLLRV